MDGDELVVYEDVDTLQQGTEQRIRAILSDHSPGDYPEGALGATFSPPGLQSSHVRDPEVVREDPYPRNVRLTDFPPEEGPALSLVAHELDCARIEETGWCRPSILGEDRGIPSRALDGGAAHTR